MCKLACRQSVGKQGVEGADEILIGRRQEPVCVRHRKRTSIQAIASVVLCLRNRYFVFTPFDK